MAVLVVGGTGTIGSEVTTQLLDAGRSVRALTRDVDRGQCRLGGSERPGVEKGGTGPDRLNVDVRRSAPGSG